MRSAIRLALFIVFCATFLWAGQPGIRVASIDDPITPVTAGFLHRVIDDANKNGDRMVLIELDTPGGLDTAMRQIVKDIFASEVPVVVYVAPSGARAASAGAIISLAADVCAMAPGTNIGAAHPVSLGGETGKTMETKVLNDAEAYAEGIARKRGRNVQLARQMVRESISLSAESALEGNVIDLMANDRTDLLKKLEGRRIVRDGHEIVLQLAGAPLISAEMSTRERILNVIGNPNVAYMLMMLGILGIFFELSNPGVILPGVVGGISILLAFFALQTLPVNYAGVLLILLALVLFIAEIKIVSHGMLTVGGIIAMIFGSLMLFPSPEPTMRLSWSVILSTVLVTVLFFTVIVAKAVKAHRRTPVTGAEGLVGEQGRADGPIAPEGRVFVRGEYWDARSDEAIAAGDPVVVEAVEGMQLRVKKVTQAS